MLTTDWLARAAAKALPTSEAESTASPEGGAASRMVGKGALATSGRRNHSG